VGDPGGQLPERPEAPGADELGLDPPLFLERLGQLVREALLLAPLPALAVDEQSRHDGDDVVEQDFQPLTRASAGSRETRLVKACGK